MYLCHTNWKKVRRQNGTAKARFSAWSFHLSPDIIHEDVDTVDSRLSARGLTALRLNRGNVFLKKKFYFPW
jgi:hypothetical protein